jgi:hypothetical protein
MKSRRESSSRVPRAVPKEADREGSSAGLAAAGAGIIALVVYVSGLSSVAGAGDTAEFQTLAATGGIAHSGYPALVLALKLFGAIPISTFAWRANLLSAVSGASAVALSAYAGARLSGRAWAGVAAALGLALSMTMWRESTEAEVYAFTLALSAGLFLCMTGFAARPSRGAAAGMGLLGGLGLVSHLSIVGLFPAAVLTAWGAWRSGKLRWEHVGAAAFGLLLGLSPLLYMFSQDTPRQPMNYIGYTLDMESGEYFPVGTPPLGTLQRAEWLLSARQFLVSDAFRPFQDLGLRFGFLGLDLAVNEWPVVGIPLIVLGAWALARRRSSTGQLIALGLAGLTILFAYGAYLNVAASFFLPGSWLLSLLAAAGLGYLGNSRSLLALTIGALLLLAPVIRSRMARPPLGDPEQQGLQAEVWAQWPARWAPGREDSTPELYGREVMRVLPANSTVLARWDEGAVMRYFRYADVTRTDVEVVMSGLHSGRVRHEAAKAMSSGRSVFLAFPPQWARCDSTWAAPFGGSPRVRLWQVAAPTK